MLGGTAGGGIERRRSGCRPAGVEPVSSPRLAPVSTVFRMADFTITEFRDVVSACFGGATGEEIKDSTLDTEFTDLGFDSLTVYEIVLRIQDDFGVSIPDEELDELRTPASLIQHVRGQLTAA